jgi:hypothetical protein
VEDSWVSVIRDLVTPYCCIHIKRQEEGGSRTSFIPWVKKDLYGYKVISYQKIFQRLLDGKPRQEDTEIRFYYYYVWKMFVLFNLRHYTRGVSGSYVTPWKSVANRYDLTSSHPRKLLTVKAFFYYYYHFEYN